MEFGLELIIISLFGGIVAMDTTASWQVMISQPLVACSIIGLLFGNPQLGLLVGILLELPWLTEIPAGGTHISEGNLGSIVAAGLAIRLVEHEINTENIVLIFSILWGILVTWIGEKLVESMRKTNVMFAYRADKAAAQANYKKITLLNIGGIGHALSLGTLLVAISYSIGTLILSKLVALVPPFFDQAFGYGKIGMLALGAGTMIGMFLRRENLRYFLVGLIIALLIYFIF